MTSTELVLVADIGGTNSRFGIVPAGELKPRAIRQIDDDGFAGLHEAIPHYLKATGEKPARAVIALAGPMKDGIVTLTNRQEWSFRPEELARQVGLARVDTVNDFAALAEALPYLPDDGLAPLGSDARARADGTKVVLGPGTGLGVAALVHRGGAWVAVPSEGGHIELAATTEREAAIYAVLRRQFGRVSAELVASGEGLERLDAAIAELDSAKAEPRDGAAISDAARKGEARAREVMDLFFAALARFSGDMALAFVARGGVYIGGGVLMKTRDLMNTARFRAAFEAKHPHEKLVGGIATVLITANYVTLTGCAAIAARQRSLS